MIRLWKPRTILVVGLGLLPVRASASAQPITQTVELCQDYDGLRCMHVDFTVDCDGWTFNAY
jgi:hypothetical protein